MATAHITLNSAAILGAEIKATIASAVAKAADAQIAVKGSTVRVNFTFNGVRVEVEAGSDPALIYRDWSRAMNGYIDGTVGPYPAAKITKAQRAKDAQIEAENKAKREAAHAEWREKEVAGKAIRDAELADAPPMDRDEAAWQRGREAQNGEGYGLAVYDYAEAWARLMQKGMVEGRALADIADETSHLADKGIGITGFMFGAAVSVLKATWAHGDELHRWRSSACPLPLIGETM